MIIETTLKLLGGLAGGVATWSFAEYALHNWYGHLGRGRNHFSREHLRHHAQKDYFAPTREKIVAALTASVFVFPLAILALGWVVGAALGGGLISMYLVYEAVHYRAHVVAPRGPYSRWVRKNHFSHHFEDARRNHGVTSPIWDLVFRTHTDFGVVRVPRKHAMRWLLDEDGEVRPEFAADYALRGRAQQKKAA